jgi:tRNA-Thr(GGU) m(6)t(6)A37 methyltransferase TsaA
MMARNHELKLAPIGRVIQGRRPDDQGDAWEEAPALIQVDDTWAGALDGVEGFSHLWVVWWLDRSEGRQVPLKVRPEGRREMPEVGVLATRSPVRPNPLALTVVRLLHREGTRLQVRGLDAFEGTPVLDIKPYLQRGDLIPEATSPPWIQELWRLHDAERGE